MSQGQYVFSQLMDHLPLTTFRRCVARYGGDRKIKHFSCLDQFRSLAFAQLTWRERLATYYVLFFIHLGSRKVDIAGITVHPNEQWMQQMARNVTMEGCGALRYCRYLLHDRDTKYTTAFRAIIESGQVKTLPLPARSPNLNAYAERWVRSVKERSVCRRSFYLVSARCGELWANTLRITMLPC